MGARGTLGNEGDPVAWHDQMIEAVDRIVAENSFYFVYGKFEITGYLQRRFAFRGKA